MRPLSVTVAGFKNLDTIHLELGGITALVATNNYGKTNLLDAIEYGADFIGSNASNRLRMMSNTSCLPLNPELEEQDYSIEFEFESDFGDPFRYVRYGFAFSWIKDDESGCRIVNEYLKMNSKQNGQWKGYIVREKGQFRARSNTRSMRSLSLDDFTLAIDVIPSLKDVEISPIVKAIKETVVLVCRSLDTTNRFSSPPIEIGPDFSLPGVMSFDDKDLPRSLYILKETKPEMFEEFLSDVYELFPTFEKVSVDSYELPGEVSEILHASLGRDDDDNENGDGNEKGVPFRIRDDQYRITITDSTLNQPVDISRMSTGTKRTIWLIANIVIAQLTDVSCLGVEEIEAGVHPRMIASLLDILYSHIDETALIVSSHSPYLVQYLKPEQIYVGLPSENGVAKFVRLRGDRIDVALDLAFARGMSLGEYLFELLTSDYDGADTLKKLVEA